MVREGRNGEGGRKKEQGWRGREKFSVCLTPEVTGVNWSWSRAGCLSEALLYMACYLHNEMRFGVYLAACNSAEVLSGMCHVVPTWSCLYIWVLGTC